MSQTPLLPSDPAPTPENNKEIRRHIRLSNAEHAQILEKAAIAGLTFSEYMRRAALGKEINEKVPPAIRKYAGNIANNLNQLTRLANSGKLNSTSAHDLEQLVQALLTIVK